MNNSDFTKGKVGDRVWSPDYGYGKVVDTSYSSIYPIAVDFDGYYLAYTIDGRRFHQSPAPTLFHEKPDCFKEKVKKTVELKGFYDIACKIFATMDLEDYECIPAKATITYEEEE